MSDPPPYSSIMNGYPVTRKIRRTPSMLRSQPFRGQYPLQPLRPAMTQSNGTLQLQGINPQQTGEQYSAQLFALCAQGIHDPHTEYGMRGIITAVVCFPCGLMCLSATMPSVWNTLGWQMNVVIITFIHGVKGPGPIVIPTGVHWQPFRPLYVFPIDVSGWLVLSQLDASAQGNFEI
ncbi:hypothetical protein EV360DRAFT_87816 [Lentinula raphanica]|nr:hypothetical protein EV360DRAFT_87816 [Lentinula raphanica]